MNSIIQSIPLYSLIYKLRYFILKKQTGFEKMEKLYESIYPKTLLSTEAAALFKLAKESKGIIVEIGAFVGLSTIILAEGSKFGNRSIIYSIDPHEENTSDVVYYPDTTHAFQYNLLKTSSRKFVKPIYDYSYNVVDKIPNKIELLFIDGNHGFDAVKNDLVLYKDKVSKTGLIAMHDSFRWGVEKAITDQLGDWKRVSRTKSLTVWKRY